jgi:hypothetical protein
MDIAVSHVIWLETRQIPSVIRRMRSLAVVWFGGSSWRTAVQEHWRHHLWSQAFKRIA